MIVTNIAAVPAFEVEIKDDLDATVPGQLTYVDQSATLNGQTTGIDFSGSILTADYSTTYGPLEPGGTIVLRPRLYRELVPPPCADRPARL